MTIKTRRVQFSKKFRSLDIFGYPISLRYQNNETYKSILGASLTVLVFIGITAYFFLMIVDMINRDSYVVTTTI